MAQKILFAAADPEAVAAFRLLAAALGKDAFCLFAEAEDVFPSRRAITTHVHAVDAAIIGLSPTRAGSAFENRVAHEMKDRHKPFSFFSEDFGSWRSPRHTEMMHDARTIFVTLEGERNFAKAWFPSSQIVVAKNPTWDSLAKLTPSRMEARQLLGISADQVAVLISGTTQTQVNCEQILETMAAIRATGDSKRFVMLYGHEPSDKTDPGLYQRVSKEFPSIEFRLLAGDTDADHIVSGMDAVVHAGISKLGLHAVLRGKGHIRVFDCPIASLDNYIQDETKGWRHSLNEFRASYRPRDTDDFTSSLLAIERHDDCLPNRPPEDLTHLKPGESTQIILEGLRQLCSI